MISFPCDEREKARHARENHGGKNIGLLTVGRYCRSPREGSSRNRGESELRSQHQVFPQTYNKEQKTHQNIGTTTDGRETYGSLERDVVHLEKGGPGPAEDVAGGEGELEGAAHEETPEDAAVHVALLRLAQERVLEACIADQHAGREGFRGFRRYRKFQGVRNSRRGRLRLPV